MWIVIGIRMAIVGGMGIGMGMGIWMGMRMGIVMGIAMGIGNYGEGDI